jgi:hypothetical protein
MADLASTVQRWVESGPAAQGRYSEGVQNTQKDVVALAVAAEGKLLAGVTQAISSGFWRRRLQEKGTAGWKAATLAKAANYGVGFQAGRESYQTAMQTWLPIIDSAASQVRQMPNNSFQDSLARMTAFATALHNAKLSR